jgi:hypothetical protein
MVLAAFFFNGCLIMHILVSAMITGGELRNLEAMIIFDDP